MSFGLRVLNAFVRGFVDGDTHAHTPARRPRTTRRRHQQPAVSAAPAVRPAVAEPTPAPPAAPPRRFVKVALPARTAPRLTAAAIGECVDVRSAFAAEDAARRAYLERALRAETNPRGTHEPH